MLDVQKNRGTLRPYLANPNVRWFDFDLTDLKEMRFEDDEQEKFAIRDGDVLICEGGEAGRAAVWNGPDIGVKFQKALHRVRTGPELFNRFLVHRLFYDYHSGGLNTYYTGATIHHLTGQDLARFEFPLPPLDEQLRIVTILDQANGLRR
jgi:type I restriction enzyme S subunit